MPISSGCYLYILHRKPEDKSWYDNQLHYRKVDGTPPGKNWTGITFSVREVAEMLGISDSSVYGLLKKKVFRTARVGQATRIYKDSFEEWYQSDYRGYETGRSDTEDDG